MTLFDSFGREIRIEKKPDDRVLSVATLLDCEPGFQSRGLTPQKLASILKQAALGDPWRQMELFEELEEKDTHLMSVLQKRRGNVSGLNYKIEPASQDKRDVDVADFILEQIESLPAFEDNLKDITDAIGKGYSALELHWGIENNRNVVTQMKRVEPKRFVWRKLDEPPRLLTDQDTMEGIELPPFKFLFHVHKTKSGHPCRQGVLRVCSWFYLFKNFGIKNWVKFAEAYGMPLRLGKYASGASPEDKEALFKALRSLGSDAAGIISENTMIEFIDSASKAGSTSLHQLLASFCNAEMSKAVLGQTLTTEQGDKGARSLGEVHENSEDDIKKDDCEQVSKTIRRDYIQPLVGFNFGWDVSLPWFHLEYEGEEDLSAEATRYKTHMESGAQIPTAHYHEKFRIPQPEGDEEVMRLPERGLGSEVAPSEQTAKVKNVMVNKSQMDDQDNVDPFVNRLMKESELSDLVQPLQGLLAESKSLEEFNEKILEKFNDMSVLKLATVIQSALEAAELTGRFEGLSEDEKENA